MRSGCARRARSSAAAVTTSRFASSPPTTPPVTRRSRASAPATKSRSPSCSARCSRFARAAAWSRPVSSRSTAPRSPRRPRITQLAAMSRSRGRSSSRAGRIDAAEDELFGEARGDELPEGLRTSGDRRKVLREAKQALEAERAAQAKKVPSGRGERLVECRRRLHQDWELEHHVVTEHAAWHAAGIASDGSRRMVGARHNIKPYALSPVQAGKINVTNPDSRNLKTTRGWVQGYNAQAVVGEGQIVLAAEISIESLDTANLQPMVQTAIGELEGAGVTETPGVVLADAGYWTNDAIEALCGGGIPTLVAPDADRRKAPRPGRRGGRYDFARRVLATDWGTELYLKRQGTVEPVFGQIKSNRGADRFQRRGRSAVRSEWRLLAATHNLLKLHRHQLATA